MRPSFRHGLVGVMTSRRYLRRYSLKIPIFVTGRPSATRAPDRPVWLGLPRADSVGRNQNANWAFARFWSFYLHGPCD